MDWDFPPRVWRVAVPGGRSADSQAKGLAAEGTPGGKAGGFLRELIIPVEGRFGHCFWSPGGRELVVTTYDTMQSDRKSWRVSADGNTSRLLPIPATEMVHDWSPDGLWLVTSSARLKPGETKKRPLAREECYVMHLDGTAERHVGPTLAKAEETKGTTLTVLPRFSPNGRTLLFGEADLEPGEGKGFRITNSRLMLQSLAGGLPGDFSSTKTGPVP
jgi:hypothetical protein